ncbi:formate-dependent phosphoribosylglycinamide formyltransferase [Mycobacterium sp. ACS4331]|uniref:formate-dependent phosphoribosylglycinamide formyltransferase n=1 Tax=Mycobacterium sp. ACS4331 TaxID=1834121 RepID=UPI0007FC623C|nr:formate-dependent phosphoribosylglycinamide formyltransferase [Mycobacterium sp. ACS4331]OBF13004.1 phosphoribosylglycinamide formyltransferase 2 [Mycobacterium sp. ACS4331]
MTGTPGARAPRVLLLGADELGREVVAGFTRLGAHVIAVDGHADAPALQVADESAVVALTEPGALTAAIERFRPDCVVSATDAVAADALATAETGPATVVPSARRARLSLDREGMRRLAADDLGLPTAPFWFAGSVEELQSVALHAGYPMVVKPLIAVPGAGQSVLLRDDDVAPAWEAAVSAGGRFAHRRVLAESVVEIDHEVTLLAVRSADAGAPQFCEPIGHRHVDGVLECWQPQQLTPVALDSARSIAARIVNAFGGRGVFGVELLVRGDEVYFSDVTALPHDSALVTARTQRLSVFDLQARAALGLPVDTIMISPGAAEVTYQPPAGAELAPRLDAALRTPESDVLVFPSSTATAGGTRTRFGVALATAPDVQKARERARQVSAALRGEES